jgi:predicted metal-dependent hydrolase
LRPTKVKELLPGFAMSMNRPVEEVSAVVSFYYKTVRSKLTSLASPSVQLDNLGTFYIKQRALDHDLERTQKLIDHLGSLTITEHAMKKDLRHRMELMSTLRQMLDIEKERRVQIIQKRFGNEPGK